MIVPSIGTLIVTFKLMCVRLQLHVSGASKPRLASSATREALLSEAGLRSFSGPRIGSVGTNYFVDDFVSCWGKRVHIGCCLNPVEGC